VYLHSSSTIISTISSKFSFINACYEATNTKVITGPHAESVKQMRSVYWSESKPDLSFIRLHYVNLRTFR